MSERVTRINNTNDYTDETIISVSLYSLRLLFPFVYLRVLVVGVKLWLLMRVESRCIEFRVGIK